MLPAGPLWKCLEITPVYPTKNKIKLYYRHALECLQAILRNPLLSDFIAFGPVRIFETAARLMRIYMEWMSGKRAWLMQVHS